MKNYFKNRKFVVTLLSILLVLCIAIGTTVAYFGSVTGEAQNMFTGAENIRARLTEPNWNAAEGLKLVPGKTVAKDPMITNTGDLDEYVAIKLTFQYDGGSTMAAADLTKLIKLLKIDWSKQWKVCEGSIVSDGTGGMTNISQSLILYFDGILKVGEVTPPIFTSVHVKDQAEGLTEADLRWLQGIKIVNGEIVPDSSGLGKFQIKVEGAAVQALGFGNVAGAVNDLKALFV